MHNETTIEKQTIYFPPLESKWNHMQWCRARSQHLGRESKPSGVVDHSEPEQPLPAMTELHSMKKKTKQKNILEACSTECLSLAFSFFKKIVIANQKGTVDKAMGSVYAGNYWQLEFDSRTNKPGQLHNKLASFPQGGGHRQCPSQWGLVKMC